MPLRQKRKSKQSSERENQIATASMRGNHVLPGAMFPPVEPVGELSIHYLCTEYDPFFPLLLPLGHLGSPITLCKKLKPGQY